MTIKNQDQTQQPKLNPVETITNSRKTWEKERCEQLGGGGGSQRFTSIQGMADKGREDLRRRGYQEDERQQAARGGGWQEGGSRRRNEDTDTLRRRGQQGRRDVTGERACASGRWVMGVDLGSTPQGHGGGDQSFGQEQRLIHRTAIW